MNTNKNMFVPSFPLSLIHRLSDFSSSVLLLDEELIYLVSLLRKQNLYCGLARSLADQIGKEAAFQFRPIQRTYFIKLIQLEMITDELEEIKKKLKE